MKKGRLLLIALPLLALSAACNKRPEGVLSDDRMAELMADMQMADAYTHTAGPVTVSKEVLVESVLKKHGVTHAQLDSTLVYYGRNMDDYYKLYEKVEKNLRARNSGVREEYDESNDIWPYSRFAAILPGQTSDGIIFSMPADGLEPGNTLEWGMRLTSGEGAEMTLGVEYADGETTFMKHNASGTRSLQVSLQTDTALAAKRIYGVVTVPQRLMPVWADSIKLVTGVYDSLAYSKIRSQKRIGVPRPKPAVKTEGDTGGTDSIRRL